MRYFMDDRLDDPCSNWHESSIGMNNSSVWAASVRRGFLQQKLKARKGGKIGTSGRGAIALRFDDAPSEFQNKVLPLLAARNLPFTRMMTSRSVAGIAHPAEAFDAVQKYSIDNGGEVWNHGTTHSDATGDIAIERELVGALRDLQYAMPKIPIDCFAPPGGNAIKFDGHMPSTTIANWADTYAGRILTAHHALVAGYFANTYYRPIDGILRDGQIHYSVDKYTLTKAKELIDRARDWHMGVVLMWHPHKLDSGNPMMSLKDFETLLDYVVAQRDAENILVLTKSGLGVADLSSSHRDDILPASSGDPYNVGITYPQFRQNVIGSTRELLAKVTSPAGTRVTSTIGTSSKDHTVPPSGLLNLRHVATIPLDTTSLTVSINAPTQNAHLYAV